MEQPGNFIEKSGRMAHGPQNFPSPIREPEHSHLPKIMGFTITPNPFIRFQLGAIRWQQIRPQSLFIVLNGCRQLFGLRQGMIIQDQGHRSAASRLHTFQKAADHTAIQSPRFGQIGHLPPPIRRAQEGPYIDSWVRITPQRR